MDIEEKSVVAFIGPSGCGKSTFLRLLNRMNDLIPETRLEGRILIDGQDIYAKGVQVDELRKNVLRVNGVKDENFIRQRVEETLKGAALWNEVKDKLKVSAYALSGGQQQRLCIARAMAVSPSVLLMDEPASALDPISTAKVEELIHELKKDYTIVIVTHNMQQAARVSDRTAFFYMGNMVEIGLYHRHRYPQHAAGGPRQRPHRLLLHGQHGGNRRYEGHLHQPQEDGNAELHHRTIRINRVRGKDVLFVANCHPNVKKIAYLAPQS